LIIRNLTLLPRSAGLACLAAAKIGLILKVRLGAWIAGRRRPEGHVSGALRLWRGLDGGERAGERLRDPPLASSNVAQPSPASVRENSRGAPMGGRPPAAIIA